MADIMLRFPELISVIERNKMHCAGCYLARFHDVSDAAFEHELDEDKLYIELIAAVRVNDRDKA